MHPIIKCLVLTIWLICSISILPGCKKAPPPAPPPPRVIVAQPVQRMLTDTLELTGNTQAVDSVQLVARVAGYLEKVYFRDGQLVKKGQPLFLIQRNTYEAGLRQADAQILLQKAQLEFAGIQLVRYTDLLKQNAAAKADVDNWRYQRDSAAANLRNAEAQRDLARLNLDYTLVAAPFDGRIDRKLQDVGSMVGSGGNTPLAQINRTHPIYVYFNISDSDLARLLRITNTIPGQSGTRKWPVSVGLVGEYGYPHEGYLDFASIAVTPNTGTLLMRGVFPNPSGRILPGLYARIRVPVEKRDYLVIPEAAVGNDQQGSFVMVVNARNTVERRNIKPGPLVDNDLRGVIAGLQGNEQVVVRGLIRATPGKPVTPVREDTRSAQSPPSAAPGKAAP